MGCLFGIWVHFVPCIWWTCDWGPYDGEGVDADTHTHTHIFKIRTHKHIYTQNTHTHKHTQRDARTRAHSHTFPLQVRGAIWFGLWALTTVALCLVPKRGAGGEGVFAAAAEVPVGS